MAKPKRPDPKTAALRRHGTLNPHPDRVTDPLFASAGFFDARDRVQVKYEMVRRVRVDGHRVRHSAAAFGFSRPSFYQAQTVPRGRRSRRRWCPRNRGRAGRTSSTRRWWPSCQRVRADRSVLRAPALARRVHERFGRTVHPRSIERALARVEKKRR